MTEPTNSANATTTHIPYFYIDTYTGPKQHVSNHTRKLLRKMGR